MHLLSSRVSELKDRLRMVNDTLAKRTREVDGRDGRIAALEAENARLRTYAEDLMDERGKLCDWLTEQAEGGSDIAQDALLHLSGGTWRKE